MLGMSGSEYGSSLTDKHEDSKTALTTNIMPKNMVVEFLTNINTSSIAVNLR
jgi:hypothetical protein